MSIWAAVNFEIQLFTLQKCNIKSLKYCGDFDKVYFNGSNQWCLIKTWFERYTYSVWSKRLGRFQSDSVVKVVCKCS